MTKEEIREKMKAVSEKLEKNGMTAYYADTKADIFPILETLMKPGESVAFGGSVSLTESGVMDWVRGGKFDIIDRYVPGLSREEMQEVFRKSFFADHFLCSTNALLENGSLYNVDGTGNRVAAMIYGPKSVILIVGCNKLVPDLHAAIERVRTVASPKNCRRLKYEGSYCYHAGHCVACEQEIPAGCGNSICHDFVLMGKQTQTGRIKVILVGEELGY